MTSPPDKLWYNPDQFDAGPVKLNDHEVQYIRADLVDELVEALERLISFNGYYFDTEQAEAALKKVTVENG